MKTLRVLAILLLAAAAPAAADDARVTRTTLPNGLRVLVRENPAAGVVAVSLLVRAGSRFETPETAGVTHFLQRVLVRGTLHRSDIDLATAAEELGGTVDASGDVEYAEIRGTSLARHWEALLTLVAEVALQPSLPPDAIQTERRPPDNGSAGQAVLLVRDSGPGVSAEDREKIFEEFYRAPRTAQIKGSGLGLTIAREIVQIHGGSIGVEPGPAGGSVFYFSLPSSS